MICNVCGYESSEAFSVCPCCGNKNNHSINTPSINISAQLIEDEESKNEYIYTGDEIQLENIKLPFGCNKNLIEKKSDNFTLNSFSGGEFFPNREISKILLSSIGFAAIGLIALPSEWVFFYLIFQTFKTFFKAIIKKNSFSKSNYILKKTLFKKKII